jgi:transposase-like protein
VKENAIMPLREALSLKRKSKGKSKRYSAQERAKLLAAYKSSGEHQKEWCEEHGIAVSTLHKWLNRDKKQAGTQITQNWAPVTVLPQTKDSMLLSQVGKFSITVEKSTDTELLLAVLSMVVPLC